MQMRSGAALLKFTDAGLLQSLNGGATFVHAAPLLFEVTYTANGQKYAAYCRNYGKTYTVSRIDSGKFKLLHNLGTTKYVTFAQCHYMGTGSTWYSFAKVMVTDSNDVTIWIIDRDGTFKDENCDVAIFRY